MYAVIKTGGKQYRVKKDDKIIVEKIDAKTGDEIEFTPLAINDGKKLITDKEKLNNSKVICDVGAHFKDKKITVGYHKKRKGYKRTHGHRQQKVALTVKSIQV
ncbi:MAG: 50S ribosomal protein L21 [Candidatus Mcinerneyibacterium aminivorans]|jgi:large subunit ribosomal protein L21|uniref:Large ribosomal subunit protein bL21 n=1 Tax=Candidatus Mcinerneyibacterium aminivorans TaxID=2703815 RepID=A0A5D0MIH5_9BACT|nr:MAG: 50S ribosomal protein L21 [Candidatus Mcinerneyibacterium aminivorans]